MNYKFQRTRRRLYITPVVKSIIIVSAVVFVLQIISRFIGSDKQLGMITRYLALNPPLVKKGMLWQFVTYIFTHGSFIHIFFNMFVLYMFGVQLETRWGSKEFLAYYLITGIAAGITAFFFMPYLTVGASGAIYGLLLAFGMTWPERKIYLYFFIPIKAKFLVVLIGGVEFLLAVFAGDSGISHVAHLGGLVAGLIYMLLRNKIKKNRKYREKILDLENYINRKQENQAVDEILDKIIQRGMGSLSSKEKKRLIDAGHYFKNYDNRV
ncbi:MAG: rhomboid family intramembrane serine protease [Candidatus Zixiibacteriota bacterium]